MKEKIPSNVIIKSLYHYTKPLMSPNYINTIINTIIQYIRGNPGNYQNLEIEAKFGVFNFTGDIKEYSRIGETFIIPDFPGKGNIDHQFKAGISPRKFYLIWGAVDTESKLIGSNIDFLGAITINETHYKNNKRRGIIYEGDSAVKEEIIRKENKKNINIRNFGNDFRITCCKEMPTEVVESDEQEQQTQRKKFRVSYQLSYFRVDFTIAKESNADEYTYEIEIEVNKLKTELVGKKNIDYERVGAILDRFIQNILNLYSVLVPGAVDEKANHSEQLEYEFGLNKHLHSSQIENIFGNYFKNNITLKENQTNK